MMRLDIFCDAAIMKEIEKTNLINTVENPIDDCQIKLIQQLD